MKLTLPQALIQLRDIAVNLEGFCFYIDTLSNPTLSEQIRSAKSLLGTSVTEWSKALDCALTKKDGIHNHYNYRNNISAALILLENIYTHDKNAYLHEIILTLHCIFTIANTTGIVIDTNDQKRLIKIIASLNTPKDW